VEKLTEKLKLSYDQSKKVQFYLDQGGKGYVLEKVALTRSNLSVISTLLPPRL
jgi:hypothetical protein